MQKPDYGGIDFNPNNLNLKEQGNKIDFNIPVSSIEGPLMAESGRSRLSIVSPIEHQTSRLFARFKYVCGVSMGEHHR